MKRLAKPRLIALGFLILALGLIGATYRTQIDGKKAHVFFVASGTDLAILTKGGTTTILGTTNANDFDFNDDGKCDWAKVTGIVINTASAAGTDTIGFHLQSGGSSAHGWHETHWRASASDEFSLDFKSMREIEKMSASAHQDTVLWVAANRGDVEVAVFGS